MTLSLGPARLAALETDDSAHSLNWLTHGQLSPGSVSGPGRRDERRARHRDGCRAGTADFRWAVKAYTRAGADGDDFNLSCDGWAESWPGHGMGSAHGTDWGTCLSRSANLPSEWQREPIPHPSFRARAQAPAPVDNGSSGEARERIGCLLWQSEILMGVRGPDTF